MTSLRITGLICLLTSAGCAKPPPLRVLPRLPANVDPQCQLARGCPTPATPLPCPADLAPLALDELMVHPRDYADHDVVVHGPLVRGDKSCTFSGCSNSCCNHCGAFLQLGQSTPGESYVHHRATTIEIPGPLGCGGDETLMCCGVDAHGQEVIARGRLHLQGMTWLLEQLTLCTPPVDSAMP
jgi:hypothetical protein